MGRRRNNNNSNIYHQTKQRQQQGQQQQQKYRYEQAIKKKQRVRELYMRKLQNLELKYNTICDCKIKINSHTTHIDNLFMIDMKMFECILRIQRLPFELQHIIWNMYWKYKYSCYVMSELRSVYAKYNMTNSVFWSDPVWSMIMYGSQDFALTGINKNRYIDGVSSIDVPILELEPIKYCKTKNKDDLVKILRKHLK